MTQTIGRTFQFEAAHSLADILPPDHICSRLHGHSYEVEVKIAGELQNGMVRGIQFEAIDLVMENLLRLVDHRLLNELITTPTVEYISLWRITSWPPQCERATACGPAGWPSDHELAL